MLQGILVIILLLHMWQTPHPSQAPTTINGPAWMRPHPMVGPAGHELHRRRPQCVAVPRFDLPLGWRSESHSRAPRAPCLKEGKPGRHVPWRERHGGVKNEGGGVVQHGGGDYVSNNYTGPCQPRLELNIRIFLYGPSFLKLIIITAFPHFTGNPLITY